MTNRIENAAAAPVAAPHSFAASVAGALDGLTVRTDAFIGGAFRPALSGARMASVTPISGTVLAEVASCAEPDMELAVAAARRAFDGGAWRNASPNERRRVLLRLADLMERDAEELALLETLDLGKPIRNTRAIDVPLTIGTVRYYAEAINKVNDEIGPSPANALSMIVREPIGVVGAVTPWNFPLLMASWKFAPALAAGNSVIMKPAEQTSLSLLRVAELAAEAGIPDGVFNVVPGTGAEAGRPLALHMDVDAIVFTGSTQVGKAIMGYAAQSNLKRIGLECGGKSPQIIMPDCPDFERAAQAAVWGIFHDQGQVCSASSRLLLHRDIRADFLARMLEITRAIQPGNPLDPETRFGAVVDARQMNKVLDYARKGSQEGAQMLCGGSQALAETGGTYIDPTIFDGVTTDMTIAREEIFGPVVAAIAFSDIDEAIRIANDSVYGLAAGIWTSDLETAHRASREIRAGNVWVNCWDGSDITTPFGGFRQSGIGRDRSLHALDKYTELKTVWMEFARAGKGGK